MSDKTDPKSDDPPGAQPPADALFRAVFADPVHAWVLFQDNLQKNVCLLTPQIVICFCSSMVAVLPIAFSECSSVELHVLDIASEICPYFDQFYSMLRNL